MIEIKGQERPFWFAIKAQRELSKADIETKDNMYMVWLGFKYGAIKENVSFDLTEEDIVDFFEVNLEAFKEVKELLAEQMGKL